MARVKVRGAGHGRVPAGKRKRAIASRRTPANAAVSEAEKRDRFWRAKHGVAPEQGTAPEKALPMKGPRGTASPSAAPAGGTPVQTPVR